VLPLQTTLLWRLCMLCERMESRIYLDLFVYCYLLVIGLGVAILAGCIPYALFPGMVRLWHFVKRPKPTPTAYDVPRDQEWPSVDLVFAAYNEEAVLREKLASLQNLDYPRDRLTVWVGSDWSNDGTEAILAEVAQEMPHLKWERMVERSGKSKIINYLVQKGQADIVVGTDANIFFHPMALKHLVAPLVLDDQTDLVGGELTYRGLGQGDSYKSIATEERSYIGWENRTKVCEGELWGMTMGVEGGCYAIRRQAFTPIPAGTFMEDFFLTMRVFASGKRVQHAALATCTEDVSNDAHMEYRRKVRISHGNWQNIFRYRMPWTLRSLGVTLAFVGHKLLRWVFPLIVSAALLSELAAGLYYQEYVLVAWNLLTFGTVAAFLLYPRTLLPKVLAKRIKPLSYFTWMNIALIHGLVQFLRSPRNTSGVWQPTKRNNQ
jgi:cellulose synthase/poly-beta-1,6-N-acetylglucosamine synthase-like glycosyltransferase